METAHGFNVSAPKVLCCLCGTLIDSNPASMCVNCLRSQVDITEGIPKQSSVYFCKMCERYHVPPKNWVYVQLESKELLALLIKRLRGLNKVKLVDAGFKWTEPHSRRILVRLSVQKEVFLNTILQQEFLVEFVVEHMQCDSCKRDAANIDAWQAVVQARQKVSHKRSFMYLEQLILKQNAHEDALGIKELADGIDFYFLNKSHALKFLAFMGSVVPVRHSVSEHLISHDANNNSYRYKYSFSAEISPLCRDDLVVLPPKVSTHMGGAGPLMLVVRVSQNVTLLDIRTMRTVDLLSAYYWKNEFSSLLNSRRLTEFTVLDSEPTGEVIGKYVITDLTVCRSVDLGSNDTVYYVRSHLGAFLNAGDLCLGYDVSNSNFNDDTLTQYKKIELPDIVIVRKTYPKRNRTRKRKWKLRSLAVDRSEELVKPTRTGQGEVDEREIFLQELEQDAEFRQAVNLYKDGGAIKAAEDIMTDASGEEDEFPDIPITELLDDLQLDDAEDDSETVSDLPN
uniref:60S ribosomal export protein NMD3 n=1 Tax=Timspurckia oligopyrenoides TaxID=708627 RepID=A0A7S0ZHW2_9RHOD|mmetsp:Transcript_5249/g.9174  ORF Transcript_5249/g.9174 Transcript_5249/m.9174 type:complete len:510 (+) Transcript_5249:158-1687(+)